MIKLKSENSGTEELPLPLHEPEDMMIVQSPCHPWEPMKVEELWSKPKHCLIYGSQFAIG